MRFQRRLMRTDSAKKGRQGKQIDVRLNRRQLAGMILAFLIIVAAVRVRTLHIDAAAFWVDEAESSINALTILEHGYPTDSYLNIPIYENTHIWFSPANQEYEFRDVSYSENHLAVYHGWLPLYAIAASFAIHGIHPDQADGTRSPKHDLQEQKRRTKAARLPAVLFGALFLVVVFAGGKMIYGHEAGWAALIVGAIHPYHLQISNQARYYSAQVTLTTACCVLLWLVIERCKWKHVCIAAALFVLLFHTHLLSFFTATVMAALSMPVIIHRHKDWLSKMFVFGVIVGAGTLPWIIVTGFYQHQSRIPRAWQLLDMPSDLLRYPPLNFWYAAPGLIILMLVIAASRSRRVFEDSSASTRRLRPIVLYLVVLYLVGWAVVGYATFLLCIPAVSFTTGRLNLSYWGPLFLLFAIVTAAGARVLAPKLSPGVSALFTSLLMLLIFLGAGHSLDLSRGPGNGNWKVYAAVFQQLDSMHLDSATRLYAAPNSHLVFSFYSGLPIQDITPVRKSYLDAYRGDIIYIDPGVTLPTGILDAERVREAALRHGYNLSPDAAEEASVRLRSRTYREAMVEEVAPGQPSDLEALPAFAGGLMAAHRSEVAFTFANFGYELVTRGFEVRDWSDWFAVLKYRFVDPQARRGIHANYADRLKGADAMIVNAPEPVAIYHSRWHPPDSTPRLSFRFVGTDLPVRRPSREFR